MPQGELVDVHQHAVLPRYRAARQAHGDAPAFMPPWSPDAALGVMDRQGIEATVLSFAAFGVHMGDDSDAADLARACNEDFVQISQEHPRLGAFATLPLPNIELACAEAVHALDVLGLDGIAALTTYGDMVFGHVDMFPLFEVLDARSATVYLHPTAPEPTDMVNVRYPEWLLDYPIATTRTIVTLLLNDVIDRFPNIKFILSHGGGTLPALGWRISTMVATQLATWARAMFPTALVDRYPSITADGVQELLGRMYYDTALIPSPAVVRTLVDLVGTDHVLFGSDWPYIDEELVVAQEVALWTNNGVGLAPDAKTSIEHGTAATLFPRLAGALTQVGII
jgi:predicted TIM-barrel fold metal-dependent hydrolase